MTTVASARASRRLLCSSVDFGFGSAGKLLSILEHLEGCQVTVVGSALLASISSVGVDAEQPPVRWIDHDDVRADDYDAALVILDPILAADLSARGLPVVYVDSLPHIWGPSDPICTEVFAYCAQLTCREAVEFPALAGVKALNWVEPIISFPEPAERDPDLAVVNVGGVHSPHLKDSTSPYVGAVVIPTVVALLEAGRTVRVTGNVGAEVSRRLADLGVNSSVVARHEFLALLSRAGLLVTSPGMTAMLEAGSAQTPTLLLPPQNLSQILNADALAGGVASRRIDWPDEWLARTAVEEARAFGEEAALEVIYRGIEQIEAMPRTAGWMRAQVARRLSDVDRWLPERVAAIGSGGARRVADHVCSAIAHGHADRAMTIPDAESAAPVPTPSWPTAHPRAVRRTGP